MKTIYRAFDGKEFLTKTECEQYENLYYKEKRKEELIEKIIAYDKEIQNMVKELEDILGCNLTYESKVLVED